MRSDDRYGQAFRKSLSLRMRELGLTQGDLALRMKTSRPYVNKALHGQINITFASAERFAKALNLDFLPQLVQPLSGKAYGVRGEG